MKKLNQAGFHLLYLAVIIVIVAALAIAGIFFYIAQQDKQKASQATISTVNRNDPFIRRYGDNCIDGPISRFSMAPVAPDQVRFIEPLGKVAGTQVLPAAYASIVPLNPSASASSYNLIMPGKGKVVSIERNTAGTAYRVVVSFNCRYFAIFDNIPQLAPELTQKIPANMEPDAVQVSDIALETGQPIGSFGNQPIQWFMVDAKATAPGLTNTTQYDAQPWLTHAIDPFSLFTKTAQTQLQAKSLRSAEPIGGKADYDKANALSGNWFKSGSGGFTSNGGQQPWLNYLSLAPNYIDPSAVIVSFGNWQNSQPAQFTVKGKVDPSTITKETSPVKYELTELVYLKPDGSVWNPTTDGYVKGITVAQNRPVIGTAMFEVQDGNKIRMQKFVGKTADQVTTFEASAELFER